MKDIISLCICALIGFSTSLAQVNQVGILEKFKKDNNVTELILNERNIPTFIVGNLSSKGLKSSASPEEQSFQFFEDNRLIFDMKDPKTELKVYRIKTDDLGMTHIRFKQYYQNLEVYGTELITHFNKVGQLNSVNGEYFNDINLSIIPKISETDAGLKALSDIKYTGEKPSIEEAKLIIYQLNKSYHLTWLFKINVKNPGAKWDYFIDADNGEFLFKTNNIVFSQDKGKKNEKGKTLLRIEIQPNKKVKVYNLEGQELKSENATPFLNGILRSDTSSLSNQNVAINPDQGKFTKSQKKVLGQTTQIQLNSIQQSNVLIKNQNNKTDSLFPSIDIDKENKSDSISMIEFDSKSSELKSLSIVQSGYPNLAFYNGTGSVNNYSYDPVTHNLSSSISVQNTGAGPTGSFRIGWYLSTNTTITTEDHLIFSATQSGITNGYYQNVNGSANLDLITTLPAGYYYLGAYFDDLKQVSESNEDDNAVYWLKLLDYTTLPNLTGYYDWNKIYGNISHQLDISINVQNNGSAAAGSFRIGYYLSVDNNITTDDYLISNSTVSSLPAETSHTDTTSINLDNINQLPKGTYFVGAYFDDLFQVRESDETDNSAFFIRTIIYADPAEASGMGIGVMGDTKSHIDTYGFPGYFALIDVTRSISNNIHNHNGKLRSDQSINTLLFTEKNFCSDENNIWDSPDQAAAIDAHVYSGITYDFMLSVLKRNSYDNQGSGMSHVMEFPNIDNNAGWVAPANAILFGTSTDGYRSTAGSIDIVAHEWGHAITQFESNLLNQKESGALNESFSDMMGVTVGFETGIDPDWQIGENMNIDGSPIRDLSNPHLCKHPDTYMGDYWIDVINCNPNGDVEDPNYNDYCGVHWNSGVPNKMFYLLSQGGVHNGITVSGIGITNALKIMYRANTTYWTQNSDFLNARQGSILAANDLDPTGSWAIQTQKAWEAVKVVSNQQSLPTVSTSNMSAIAQTSATGGGNVTSDGGAAVTARGVCWSTSQNPTMINSKTTDGSGIGAFTSSLKGLSPNTSYYVRAYAVNSAGTGYGDQKEFATAVEINCDGTFTDNRDGQQYCYKTIGTQTCLAENLAYLPAVSPSSDGSNTSPYYYVYGYEGSTVASAKATANYGTYGVLYNWEAAKSACPSGWHLPSDAEWTILTNYLINNEFGYEGSGIDIGKSMAATSGWSANSVLGTVGNDQASNNRSGFSGLPGGLRDNSGVFFGVISYTNFWSATGVDASNAWGRGLGYDSDEMSQWSGGNKSMGISVRCLRNTFATVTTTEVTGITATIASSGGNITNDGGASITARGVCWAPETDGPTIDRPHTTDGTGTGLFTSNLTGLTGNTRYFVRAYATNNEGTSYGNPVSFRTSPVLPTVTTSSISAITQTTAVSGGNVISGGGGTITVRGVCWSTSSNPTTGDSKTTDGTGTGSFASSLNGLTGNTTYFVRAYATNSTGTSYGNEVSFKTSPVLPTVTTSSISAITQTTAVSGGNVNSGGGATVTARGVCWSTTQNPTTANTKTSNGTGIGSYTSNLTGLTANTTYYVKAYATNSVGTSYGTQVPFTTGQNISAPTVTTVGITDITQTSANGVGNVTSDGGASVTERGVCWSISENPSIVNNRTFNGISTGVFIGVISGLSANTTYYIRAYATNSAGTGYGSQLQFKTLAVSGIDDESINDRIKVYPNPTQDIINVDFTEFPGVVDRIELINQIGKVVYSSSVQVSKRVIQVSSAGLTSGFYIMQVTSGDRRVKKTVIIE